MKLIPVARMKSIIPGLSTVSPGILGWLLFASLSCSVANAEDSGWYIGGNVGQSRATIDEDNITEDLVAGGATSINIDSDEKDIGYKLFGGYQFNRYLALEGGYFDLGEFGFDATTVPAGTLDGKIRVKGLNFDVVGMFPFTEKLSAFGRLGVNYAKVDDSFHGSGAVVADSSPDSNDTNYKYGAGLQYNFTPALAMRLEAERYRVDDAVENDGDIDLASIGLVYRFGADEKPVVVEEKPVKKEAVVEKAPVAPVVVIVPVKAKTEEYCSILDIQYEINGDEIQREEKEKLGVLGTFLKKYPDTTAIIEGHTDDVGSSKDNLELSQRRAEGVVAYLEDTFQIAPSRLKAIGYGETRPLVSNDSGTGKQWNRRIGAVIACAMDVEDLMVLPARVTMAMELQFEPYKSDIKPEYHANLARVADFMMKSPKVTATVEAHAGKFVGNSQVSEDTSMEVSQRRAKRVVDHLVNLGVARSRLSEASYGQERRVSYGTTLEGQQENRRVNIIFNY